MATRAELSWARLPHSIRFAEGRGPRQRQNAHVSKKAGKARPNTQPLQIALCLSGGGFGATLFHLGVMRGLQRAGLLEHVETIAAVSGGSILAAASGVARSKTTDAGNRLYFH